MVECRHFCGCRGAEGWSAAAEQVLLDLWFFVYGSLHCRAAGVGGVGGVGGGRERGGHSVVVLIVD